MHSNVAREATFVLKVLSPSETSFLQLSRWHVDLTRSRWHQCSSGECAAFWFDSVQLQISLHRILAPMCVLHKEQVQWMCAPWTCIQTVNLLIMFIKMQSIAQVQIRKESESGLQLGQMTFMFERKNSYGFFWTILFFDKENRWHWKFMERFCWMNIPKIVLQ